MEKVITRPIGASVRGDVNHDLLVLSAAMTVIVSFVDWISRRSPSADKSSLNVSATDRPSIALR
jgi:hypothetical protein